MVSWEPVQPGIQSLTQSPAMIRTMIRYEEHPSRLSVKMNKTTTKIERLEQLEEAVIEQSLDFGLSYLKIRKFIPTWCFKKNVLISYGHIFWAYL